MFITFFTDAAGNVSHATLYEDKKSPLLNKRVNLASTKVTGDRNEAGIKRIKKALRTGEYYQHPMFGNTLSEADALAYLG
jgi:hypothetical protein